jgi:hypothetical protein
VSDGLHQDIVRESLRHGINPYASLRQATEAYVAALRSRDERARALAEAALPVVLRLTDLDAGAVLDDKDVVVLRALEAALAAYEKEENDEA